jgi:hypothetical protein
VWHEVGRGVEAADQAKVRIHKSWCLELWALLRVLIAPTGRPYRSNVVPIPTPPRDPIPGV